MTLKAHKYRHHFDGFDLTEEQKTAMCEALWTIAEAVADLAWGVHPAQLVGRTDDNDSLCESNVVRLFEQAANAPIPHHVADILARFEAANDNKQEQEEEEARS